MSDMSNNYEDVIATIEKAAKKAHRNVEDITLIAVSKTKPIAMIEEAIKLGMDNFGENKPQEIRDKTKVLGTETLHWHMIGHLQSNKIKYVIETCDFIHSVDSVKLGEELEKEAIKRDCDVFILLQVNVADEESKGGFSIEECYNVLPIFAAFKRVHVQGLMTIAPYVDNPEDNRQIFRQLHEIFVDIKSKNIDNVSMNALSMGMTGDYEVAIEEGATHIRVGTGIFGERNYNS